MRAAHSGPYVAKVNICWDQIMVGFSKVGWGDTSGFFHPTGLVQKAAMMQLFYRHTTDAPNTTGSTALPKVCVCAAWNWSREHPHVHLILLGEAYTIILLLVQQVLHCNMLPLGPWRYYVKRILSELEISVPYFGQNVSKRYKNGGKSQFSSIFWTALELVEMFQNIKEFQW